MVYTICMDTTHFWLYVTIAFVWSLVWKGLALWRAAKRSDKWWFFIFLIVNTLGILEIIYLFAFAKVKLSDLWPRQ